LRESRPDDTERLYRWDDSGQLSLLCEKGKPAADGGIAQRLQQFRHDAAGQLIWRAHDHAEYHYQRDNMGRLSALTRQPTAAGAALGIDRDQLHFVYDAAGRLVSEDAANGKLAYQWDALGNLCALTLPDEQQLSWLHYGSGHVSAIKFNQQVVSEFTRDRLHRETQRTQGAREQFKGYDSLGRRTLQRSQLRGDVALPEQAILERAFRYTARGELAGVSDTLRGEVNYGYDAEGRLLKHNEPRQSLTSNLFAYDAADNLAANDDLLPATPTTDNRLRHWQQLFLHYDSWGNLTRRRNGLHEQHYQYDAENRLIAAHGTGPQGQFRAQYHYDALGRRIRKEVSHVRGSDTTRFLWQGPRPLQESKPNGQCRTYVYDPNETWSPLARIDHHGGAQGDIFWFSTDLNSAPLEVSDETGAVRWSGQYDSFGQVKRQSEGFQRLASSQPTLHQPLRYAGQYADDETGLHYNLFRYYDPQMGRFIVQDPIGLAGGINLYQYAVNPLSWVDPWGLSNFFTPSIFHAPSGSTHTVYQQAIDWDLPVNTRNGIQTNLDLASQGRSPFVVKDGVYSQINLHHSKQNGLGSLFELSSDTHKKYYGTNALHPHLPMQHPINPVNRDSFNIDRGSYWQQRAKSELRKRNLKNTCRG